MNEGEASQPGDADIMGVVRAPDPVSHIHPAVNGNDLSGSPDGLV